MGLALYFCMTDSVCENEGTELNSYVHYSLSDFYSADNSGELKYINLSYAVHACDLFPSATAGSYAYDHSMLGTNFYNASAHPFAKAAIFFSYKFPGWTFVTRENVKLSEKDTIHKG